MKNLNWKSIMLLALSVAYFVVGKGETHAGIYAITAVALTLEEKAEFSEPEQKMLLAVKKMVSNVEQSVKDGKITPEELGAFKSGVIDTLKNTEIKALNDELTDLKAKALKQGTSLAEMELKITKQDQSEFKSIGSVLESNEEELKRVFMNGSGQKTFLVQANAKGQLVMKPFDMTKAAGPHATVANVGGVGNAAAISVTLDAATLLRIGSNSAITSNYRNTPWVFDLVNVVNAGFEMPFAMWYEEQAKVGASALVLEGAAKPLVQYSYALRTASYRKEAALIGFTDEFAMDFARLQDDIMNKGRIDVINRINQGILTNLTAAATTYNTSALFNGGVARPAAQINDYVAIAAMAAQVDNATYGSLANAAVMSTFKKYSMGTTLSTTGEWIDRCSVLDNLAFIGNPDMAANAIMVGDFKAYNLILRGGFIVKVGYNGTDFAENRFSVVMEQYYYDYISSIRQKAIVKGPDFATVKAALAL